MLDIAHRRLALAAALILAVVAAVSVWASIAPPLPVAGPAGVSKIVTPVSAPPVATPPAVEPLKFKPVSVETAREINQAIPFATAPNPAAAPFRFAGSPEDLARATDCLAAATYYEAGADTKGRAAVAQVILNRLRHPAFPKSVCGVVFQGSERKTGCQFTFTCDGALARIPAPAAWQAARKTATAALTGTVFAPVGHATHYHTDWVTPYWSESLDKITAVDTHLFFRWKGWWGTPKAFAGKAMGEEPVEAQIAGISGVHGTPANPIDRAQFANLLTLKVSAQTAPAAQAQAQAQILFENAEGVALILDRATDPAAFPQIAAAFCGQRDLCKVRLWTDRRAAPAAHPIDSRAMGTMAFSLLWNQGKNFRRPQWNCREFHRVSKNECLVQPFAKPAIAENRAKAAPGAIASLAR